MGELGPPAPTEIEIFPDPKLAEKVLTTIPPPPPPPDLQEPPEAPPPTVKTEILLLALFIV